MTRRMMKMDKREMINVIRDNVDDLFNRVIDRLPYSLLPFSPTDTTDRFILRFIREDDLTLKCIDPGLIYFATEGSYFFDAIIASKSNDKFILEKVLFKLKRTNKYENYEALYDDDGRKIGYYRKDMFVCQNDTHRFYLVETVYSRYDKVHGNRYDKYGEFYRKWNASYKYFPSSEVKYTQIEFPYLDDIILL